MTTKVSGDAIPLKDIKVKPGTIVKQLTKGHRPLLLTSRGRGVAVIQALSDYESDAEERQYMRAVVEGLLDAEEGHELSIAEVRKRLNLSR